MYNLKRVLSFLAILLLLNTFSVNASHSEATSNVTLHIQDQVTLCVKYQTQTGWSKGYTVDVNVIKGSTLNRKTGTYNYDSYATYAVIFWSNEQASVIKLNYYSGSFTATGTHGIDQQGRKWKLAKTSLCY